MTWLTDEQSVKGSRVVELYTFTTSGGTIYRLTSFRRDFTHGGNTYTAGASSRSALTAQGATSSDDDFTIEVPAQHPLSVTYSGAIVPPRELYVTVDRLQRTSGVALRIAEGYVSGPAFKGRMASFRITMMSDLLAALVPGIGASRLCQHVLYDSRCGVGRGPFTVATTISTIASDRKSITVASIGGNPDQWFRHGEILFNVTTERRTVTNQVGTTIGFRFPLPSTIAGGAAVSLYAGCDHTIATCRTKFANVANFGGFPKLPKTNIYWVDIRTV
jgi:hypothetical protein